MPAPLAHRPPLLAMTPSSEHAPPPDPLLRSDSAASTIASAPSDDQDHPADGQSDAEDENDDDDDNNNNSNNNNNSDREHDHRLQHRHPNRRDRRHQAARPAHDTSVPRPLGPRRRTVPSIAYPERPRTLEQLEPTPQPHVDSRPSGPPSALAADSKSAHPESYRPSDSSPLSHSPPLRPGEPRSDPSLPRPACSICGDTPRSYGLLANCDHAFCVSCLHQWRQQGTTSDQDELTSNFKCCPLCRTQSLLCVRSPDFLTGQAKTARIDAAMAPKKGIPCRYFVKSMGSSSGPFCPFGDDCFYLHKLGHGQFHFGLGAEQMQAKSMLRRRVAAHRSYPPSEDEGSDTESNSSRTSASIAANEPPVRPTTDLRRFGSVGRARTRFGGSGLGLTPMAQSPALSPAPSAASPTDSPAGEQRRLSFGIPTRGLPDPAVYTSPGPSTSVQGLSKTTSSSAAPSGNSAGSGPKERRSSLAAAATAARNQREAKQASLSHFSPRGSPAPSEPASRRTSFGAGVQGSGNSRSRAASPALPALSSPGGESNAAGTKLTERRGSIAAAAAAARKQREARAASLSSSSRGPPSSPALTPFSQTRQNSVSHQSAADSSGVTTPALPLDPLSQARRNSLSARAAAAAAALAAGTNPGSAHKDPRILLRSMILSPGAGAGPGSPAMMTPSSSAIDSGSSSDVSRPPSPALLGKAG